jgi:DEAD/DEAH box helicase domain-containing protein
MRKIVFDIETRNIFSEVGSNNPRDLDISMVGVYDYSTDSYTSYLEEELPKLWPILESTDILIGYNSDHFDIPLLDKYYPGDLLKIKSVDILKEIKNSANRRMKLDQVAEGTLGINKSGHGLDAIKWWHEGNIEKIRDYCIDDVKITKQIYDYALKNGKIFYREGGKNNEVLLDTSFWESVVDLGALNHTLPF